MWGSLLLKAWLKQVKIPCRRAYLHVSNGASPWGHYIGKGKAGQVGRFGVLGAASGSGGDGQVGLGPGDVVDPHPGGRLGVYALKISLFPLVEGVAEKFMPMYEASHGQCGYVSIQGDPFDETEESIVKYAKYRETLLIHIRVGVWACTRLK